MPFFESSEQLQDVFREFWSRVQLEDEVMERLAKSGIIVRFDIEQPEVHVTIDFKNTGPDGKLGNLSFDSDVEPDIAVWSTSETTNKFWQGKLNTTIAMAKRQVKMDGSIPKAMGLLSKIKPLFKIFPQVLKDQGLDHMVL
ncbi:MAG: hypothetical protein BAJATHORv1_30402 [Candidatus Thorarchaeota archaeon]|nr:MAG: hypothetical protein BAJATHORv1_30402 [Candidatus Thorarchaeota archaeon]